MIRRLLVPAMLVAIAAPSASAQGFGPPVAGQDTRTISAVVGPDVSSVPATESFTGRERWELELQNQSGPLLTGAQIIVNSGYDLTDSSLFRFVAMLDTFVPGPPGPPTTFPCSVSSAEADCPASPSTVALPPGSSLAVQANGLAPAGPPNPPAPPWLAPGVPKAMTPGFDSAVNESAFAGGTASLHVLVTLRDATRYANSFEIGVKIDGNAVPGSGTVTSSSGPVPACPPGPPVTTCFRVNYGPPFCNDSRQGDGSANFSLDLPRLDETYDFGSSQTAMPTCPNPPARPHVQVLAQHGGAGCPGGPGCSPTPTTSITIPDADLRGSITYRVNEPTEMVESVQTRWAIDYLPIFAIQQHSTSTGVSCSPATIVEGSSTTCTATVSDTASSGQTTPTGSVGFTSSGTGSFSSSSCTLAGSGSSATCSVSYTPSSSPTNPVRSDMITASYGGDTTHASSSGLTAVQVLSISLLPRGSFVIGDATPTGSTVTFWSDQWSTLNSLSGGPAPAAFKGFAGNTPNSVPQCGDRWTTEPGNGSNPPDTVPPYMAVTVASQITHSSSTISGDTTHVVVVKTDPGYAPSPGHTGTGTVVAQLC